MEQQISKAEIRYGDTNQGFITLRAVRNEGGGMEITIIDAFFRTDTGNEIPDIITDFKGRVLGETKPEAKPNPKPSQTRSQERKPGRMVAACGPMRKRPKLFAAIRLVKARRQSVTRLA